MVFLYFSQLSRPVNQNKWGKDPKKYTFVKIIFLKKSQFKRYFKAKKPSQLSRPVNRNKWGKDPKYTFVKITFFKYIFKYT